MTQRPSRDRIVVSTSRCGRDNPGSNPGHGSADVYSGSLFFLSRCNMFFSISARVVIFTVDILIESVLSFLPLHLHFKLAYLSFWLNLKMLGLYTLYIYPYNRSHILQYIKFTYK